MTRMKISCRQASRILSKREDMSLSLKERVQLWLHLRICDACTRVERQFASLRLAMQKLRERE